MLNLKTKKMKRNILLLLATILVSTIVHAQFIKEKSLSVQIGYGLSAPFNSVTDVVDDGFFAQTELVLSAANWIEFRPYAAFILTSSNGEDLNNNPTTERAETTAVLLGGKARVRAPIKWVAPYLELGLGASIGKFETFTAFDNIAKNGIIYHIPLAIGLELGPNNTIDLGLAYFLQPTVEQFAGAFALGVSFPLN